MIGDAKCNEVIFSQYETCAALLGCATNTAPISVAVAAVKVIVDDEKRLFSLALNVENVACNDKKSKENLLVFEIFFESF